MLKAYTVLLLFIAVSSLDALAVHYVESMLTFSTLYSAAVYNII
jgi:hypothetical protein